MSCKIWNSIALRRVLWYYGFGSMNKYPISYLIVQLLKNIAH